MKHLRGNIHLMKEINRSTILSILHRDEKLSRAEIAKVTKLSATTISSLVDELINEGLIVEVGMKTSSGAGRKAIALEINRNQGGVISIELGYHEISCTLFNFHSKIVAETTVPAAKGNDHVMHSILECIQKIVQKADVSDFSEIKGIGISSPGIVEETSGTIMFSQPLQLENFKIAELLRARFNLPIYIMNDTNAAAFAEYYLGTSTEIKNILYVRVYDGVGATLILNGQINSGYEGRAGEVTFIKDNFITSYVLSQVRKRAAKYDASKIPNGMEDILKMYEDGVIWLEPLMNRILLVLSKAIANMINFIGPEHVVLDGWFIGSPKCMKQFQCYLDKFTIPVAYPASRVVTAKFGDKNHVIGAATMVLYQLFKGKV